MWILGLSAQETISGSMSYLRYATELHIQGTVEQIRKAEGLLSRGARIVIEKVRRNWSKRVGFKGPRTCIKY